MIKIGKRVYNLLKEYFNIFVNFMKSNILFLAYLIIIILIGLTLKLTTLNTILPFRSLIGDLIVALLLGAFAFLIRKRKYQYYYLLLLIILSSFLCIGNCIYYEFYQSYLSINLLATASMLGEVDDSVYDKLKFIQFLSLIYPIIYIIIYKLLNSRDYFKDKYVYNKKVFFNCLKGVLVFILLLATTFTYKDAGSFQKQWNRDYIVKNFGVNIYTINDFRQSIHPKLSALFDYDKDVLVFKQYYSCKWEKEKRVNEYTNKFKGKNVLFIHAESIQNFLINLKVNGKEVTPNINKFASEGMYFSKFYPQISIGTSSDTEFTLTTGLMPSSSGTVFVNYYDRTYYGMPNYFKQLGYYTFSAHGNNADYWNRKVMHKRLGYDDFYAKDSFDVTESNTIGLGISDKAFFNQMIPILKNIKNEKTNYFGTIITLTNHSPFNDVDKYGDFDLSVNYSYTNSRGVTKTKTSNYLENSSIGNYLKSAHYADEAFGEFIDSLEENNLLENTIIVFYGDHESRLSRNEFNKLYNYDPETRLIKDEENPSYIDVSGYNYDLLKNTPLIIWSNEEDLSDEVTDVMGMYDVLPTIANMFGFEEKYSLGNDIFSDNDKIVVFPNGNVLTNDIYYDDLKDEYITFNNNPIDVNYINDLKEYADKILDVSNGIVSHDLIKNEASLVGECNND